MVNLSFCIFNPQLNDNILKVTSRNVCILNFMKNKMNEVPLKVEFSQFYAWGYFCIFTRDFLLLWGLYGVYFVFLYKYKYQKKLIAPAMHMLMPKHCLSHSQIWLFLISSDLVTIFFIWDNLLICNSFSISSTLFFHLSSLIYILFVAICFTKDSFYKLIFSYNFILLKVCFFLSNMIPIVLLCQFF